MFIWAMFGVICGQQKNSALFDICLVRPVTKEKSKNINSAHIENEGENFWTFYTVKLVSIINKILLTNTVIPLLINSKLLVS